MSVHFENTALVFAASAAADFSPVFERREAAVESSRRVATVEIESVMMRAQASLRDANPSVRSPSPKGLG
jgi:hypothetical protein